MTFPPCKMTPNQPPKKTVSRTQSRFWEFPAWEREEWQVCGKDGPMHSGLPMQSCKHVGCVSLAQFTVTLTLFNRLKDQKLFGP